MNEISALLEDSEFLKKKYAFSYNRINSTYDAEDLASCDRLCAEGMLVVVN